VTDRQTDGQTDNGAKINLSFSFGETKKTRGPRGPWVAHLMKRSKVTVEPIIENPRGII